MKIPKKKKITSEFQYLNLIMYSVDINWDLLRLHATFYIIGIFKY